jgi:Protein of unknown function (DUF3040)
MSLNAHDTQELDVIEESLSGSDPHLASMLSVFSRLADGEAMPGYERIQVGEQHRPSGPAFRALLPGRPGTCRPRVVTRRRRPRWSAQWAVPAAWLVISLVLITVAVLLSHTRAPASCGAWPAVPVCGTHAPAHQQSQPLPGLAG